MEKKSKYVLCTHCSTIKHETFSRGVFRRVIGARNSPLRFDSPCSRVLIFVPRHVHENVPITIHHEMKWKKTKIFYNFIFNCRRNRTLFQIIIAFMNSYALIYLVISLLIVGRALFSTINYTKNVA